jgi:hypothetical protein
MLALTLGTTNGRQGGKQTYKTLSVRYWADSVCRTWRLDPLWPSEQSEKSLLQSSKGQSSWCLSPTWVPHLEGGLLLPHELNGSSNSLKLWTKHSLLPEYTSRQRNLGTISWGCPGWTKNATVSSISANFTVSPEKQSLDCIPLSILTI